ncbi:MAG: hypothetical protein NTX47_07075 [Candidatus Omnitrophica bacterium]|nr:hypothetical protein [Candidatus Omnitrophota bacterium]
MMRNIFILCFFCAVFVTPCFAQEDTIEIDSQVMSVNSDKEYIIIKAGENQGIEIGDGLIIHRDGDKIAEAQVVEVRPDVSAAEILNVEKEQIKELVEQVIERKKEIKEGDSILIVKKAKKYPTAKTAEEEKNYREPKKSKWTTLLGSSAGVSSAAPVETVSSEGIETIRPGMAHVTQEGSVVRADIGADLNTVFSYALMVLRENGYSVLFSSRASGLITATIPIELSIMSELWADVHARIGHKLVVSLELKDKTGSTELNVSSFKEHTQKGKQIKFPVVRESKYYINLVELASKIKERAEH